ncbi:hypothetical protein [Paenibacillus macerans]|uniref:hypothetical protein n=1 Tax=Paenibacillus macerans TaxID=44252 RepID=UPI003D3206E4
MLFDGCVSRKDSSTAIAEKSIILRLFFPHLVAGPIIRYSDIERQIERPRVTLPGFSEGITRFMLGLGKKVLLANLLGEAVPQLLNPGSESASVLGIWFGISLYALQIYFDFSIRRLVSDRDLAWGELELCNLGALLRGFDFYRTTVSGKVA